jgi:hypothetical protein
MSILDRVNWDVWSDTLMKGNPPLIVQLLALNSIVFIFFIVRRLRHKAPRRGHAAHIAQALLIVANFAVLTQEQLRPYYHGPVQKMINSIDRSISHMN